MPTSARWKATNLLRFYQFVTPSCFASSSRLRRRILDTLSDRTQFIVITHRRGTMEAADVLYGVTMQEQGVSKILRLSLDELAKQLGITA